VLPASDIKSEREMAARYGYFGVTVKDHPEMAEMQ